MLLCFNKHRLGEDLLGTGTFCRVKEAMDLKTGELFAFVVQEDRPEARAEYEMQRACAGEGVAPVLGYARWPGKRGAQKLGTLMPSPSLQVIRYLSMNIPIP